MQLQWERKQIPALGVKVWETQNQEQTLELRLGESMPDIGHIICAWGQPLLRTKEWQSDQMQISGGVQAWVLYAPEDGSAPQCMEAWLPFQMKWNLPETQRDGIIRCDVHLGGVDGRVLSARKMLVRAQISALGQALEPETVICCVPEETPAHIQLLRQTYPVRLLSEAGEKQIRLDEDLVLQTRPAVRIISCTVQPMLDEQQVVGGKAVFRGNCAVHVVYSLEDGMIHSEDHDIPFAQYADLDKDFDKAASLDTMMAVSDLETELIDGGLRLKCSVIAQYVVTEERLLETAQDAYSVENTLSLQMWEPEIPVILDTCSDIRTAKQNDGQVQQSIIDACCFSEQPVLRRSGDTAQVQIPLLLQLLCRGEDGQYFSSTVRFVEQWQVHASEDCHMMLRAVPSDTPKFAIAADGMECSVSLLVEMQTVVRQPLSMISDIEVGQKIQADEARPSMILRRAGQDTLWQIAKNYGSTVDAIRTTNGIDDISSEQQMLLIPIS